jgi:hypothetical protein
MLDDFSSSVVSLTVQTRSCGLFCGVASWEFWWIGEELGSQQYVVWQVVNFMDGFPLDHAWED